MPTLPPPASHPAPAGPSLAMPSPSLLPSSLPRGPLPGGRSHGPSTGPRRARAPWRAVGAAAALLPALAAGLMPARAAAQVPARATAQVPAQPAGPVQAQAAGPVPEIFKGADLQAGEAFIRDLKCDACHARRTEGRPYEIYKPQGRIHTAGLLRGMVEYCNTELNLGLFPEDVTAIAAVLNRDHYRFTK